LAWHPAGTSTQIVFCSLSLLGGYYRDFNYLFLLAHILSLSLYLYLYFFSFFLCTPTFYILLFYRLILSETLALSLFHSRIRYLIAYYTNLKLPLGFSRIILQNMVVLRKILKYSKLSEYFSASHYLAKMLLFFVISVYLLQQCLLIAIYIHTVTIFL